MARSLLFEFKVLIPMGDQYPSDDLDEIKALAIEIENVVDRIKVNAFKIKEVRWLDE